MKRFLCVVLILISTAFCLLAGGCFHSTNPHEYPWHLRSYTLREGARLSDGKNMSRTFETKLPTVFDPIFATYTKKAHVTMAENGEITLHRYTGETLTGTYETVKPKMRSRVMTAYFENGYIAHIIMASATPYPTLHIDLLGEDGGETFESYLFTANPNGQIAQEEYEATLKDIASAVRNAQSSQTDTIIRSGTVYQKNGKYFLESADKSATYDLFLATQGLFAIKITEDGVLQELTQLQTGTCYYASETLPTQGEKTTFAVAIYY